jgi:membrane protein YqaA with SNARE-associated domain
MSVQAYVSPLTPSPRPVHHAPVPHWLTHLGTLGLFAVAVIDSSVIPLPLPGSTDLLLLWLVSHHGNPWLLATSAVAGSILGGYTCWSTGKKGGEAALQRYVNARLLKRISRWVEKHAILSVFLPAVLPPPIPLSPFLLASGALGVSGKRFVIIFGAARSVRYAVVAWLAVVYGRRMVRLWSATLDKWSSTLLWAFAGMALTGICIGIWKLRSQRKSLGTAGGSLSPANAQVD